MNPSDFPHSDDYAKAFTAAHPGFFPTYFSSLQTGWEISKETEKAVLVSHEHWFPKSQVLIESGRVVGVKKGWYKKILRSATRQTGW
jgi:hypothetical protein